MAEQAEQQRQQKAAYSRASVRRLQAEGLVLLDLAATAEGRLYTDFVWRFSLASGAALPYHRFKRGDTVILTPSRPLQRSQRQRRAGGGSMGSWSEGEGDEEPYGEAKDPYGLAAGAGVMAGSGRAGDGSSGGEGEGEVPGAVGGGGGAEEAGALEGTMLEVQRGEVAVAVPKGVAEALGAAPPGTLWRMDQGVSAVTTRRQLAALSRLDKLLNPACQGEALVRALLLGSRRLEELAKQPTAWAQEEAWRADAAQELGRQQGLNQSQMRAVATALTRTFTLWQGPPGTGKTRTLLALLDVLSGTAARCPLRRREQGAILAVADTNAAADNILEGLLQRGIPVVRVGQPAKVRPELRHACLDAQVEGTPAGKRAAQYREAAEGLMSQIRQKQAELQQWRQQEKQQERQPRGQVQQQWEQQQQQPRQAPLPTPQAHSLLTPQQLAQQRQAQQAAAMQQQQLARQRQQLLEAPAQIRDMRRQADKLWAQADAMVSQEALRMLREAQVVVSTCNGAGEARLEQQRFRIVVLDEASQATEASSLVPLVKGAECVVLAGDQRQLPPTVLSQQALNLGLDIPLFTRLLEAGVSSLLLDEQYRMHPAIAAFPSQHFYGGAVRSGVDAAARPPVAGVPWTSPDCPVLFINVEDGYEQQEARGRRQGGGGGESDAEGGGRRGQGGGGGGGEGGRASYSNPAEADMAVRVLLKVLQGDPSLESVALLSPYSGQVRLLTSLLSRLPLPGSAAQRCSIAVSTVDGYQGREADCVVFSAVRCNEGRRVGFLSDQRRLNVAITRPRRGLIVIGHQDTLAADPSWRAWMQWVAAQRKARPPQHPQQQRPARPGAAGGSAG